MASLRVGFMLKHGRAAGKFEIRNPNSEIAAERLCRNAVFLPRQDFQSFEHMG